MAAVDEDVCANCGIAEVDNITLEECDACKLVRYCSDKCREEHQDQHEEECKKRNAELHDRKLFTQPDETHRGDCPICFLPMSLDQRKSTFYSCCSKTICIGCEYANERSHYANKRSHEVILCPFCREPVPDKEEYDRRMMKRVKANDPAALREMGAKNVGEGDYESAFEYYIKAAELGDLHAHFQLGCMYRQGVGVEKDMEKAAYHWEKAAIGGHPRARRNLAVFEEEKGNMERAVKHYIIAANLGDEESMKALWVAFKRGQIKKEDLEATLRTHQAAVDAMKSPQREKAELLSIR